MVSLHWFGGRIWPIAGEDSWNTVSRCPLLSYFRIALLLGDLQWSIKTPCKRSVGLDRLQKLTCQEEKLLSRKSPHNILKLRGTGYYCCSAYHCLEELEKQAENPVCFLSCPGGSPAWKFPVVIHKEEGSVQPTSKKRDWSPLFTFTPQLHQVMLLAWVHKAVRIQENNYFCSLPTSWYWINTIKAPNCPVEYEWVHSSSLRLRTLF